MAKVVLGLSGGVDSAVSARLLQEAGFDVYGLFLDIGSPAARGDATSAADMLGIPLEIIDIRNELEENVCKPFTSAYLSGETPNPCVICNPSVKFANLCRYADIIGAEYIATGHYARTKDKCLLKGATSNDQSYMLCRLKPDQVSRLLLPLGNYEKAQVRAMAEDFGIPVAKKPDSMEICFIPDNDHIRWLEKRTAIPVNGDLVLNGETIGRHEGIHRYTVGQRMPFLYNERRVYVSRIDAETNRIELCLWDDLFFTDFTIRDVSWLIDSPSGPIEGSVRVRHTKWENPNCSITPVGTGAVIHCETAVRAPAAGQTAALYVGDRVIGGGFIEKA